MRILLAVSGGIDSMCMADMFSRTEKDLAIAHCNFHLRGKDSDTDAKFVREWAEAHGARYYHADFDTEAYASEHGISIEMAARELRYAWFGQVAADEGFDAVAVAHNANDNAETLMLNLLRGTGSRGLRGMSALTSLPAGKCPEGCDVLLIRPLLGMSRADIEEYAREHGVRYREDRTNSDPAYKRNRIRNIVFPEFGKINPSYIRTLNEDISRFKEVDDIAEEWFHDNCGAVFNGSIISINALLGLKHWKYMLFRILEPYGFNSQTLDSLYGFLERIAEGKEPTISGKRFHANAYMLETSTDTITLMPNNYKDASEGFEIEICSAGTYSFNGSRITVEEIAYAEGMSLKPAKNTLLCDAEALGYPFSVRHWRSGDWMRPFGMGGKAKKASDIFTDLKYSLSEKEKTAIIFSPAVSGGDGSHIASIACLRMDEALRITEGSRKIIRISII